MTAWGNHQHIIGRLQRFWRSGRLLGERLNPDSTLFPLRVPLKHPNSRALTDHFDAARQWIAALRQASERHGYTLEWKTINHRQLGANQLPVAAIIDNNDQALMLLRKLGQARDFDAIARQITTAFPELHGWLARKPLKALAHRDDWPRLLAILGWLREHPRPGIYLRQIDLPGVHTKFIEAHRGLLGELLDIVLPEEAIDADASGAKQFQQRYGFVAKPALIRFRLLDPAQHIHGLSDLSIPLQDFRQLEPPARRIFITENDINGLAFPELPDSLVIFGLGYGVDALGEIPWLAVRDLHYWGDIDTHGFAMLDQLRGYHPHARSLLMDEATLLDHQSLWGEEPAPTHRELSRLDSEEHLLYDKLRNSSLGDKLRLEQERIRFGYLLDRLAAMGFQ